MSQNAPADSLTRPPPTAAHRRIRLWVWLLVVAMVGPCAYVQTPREVALWYLAAAQVEREAKNQELADRYIARAKDWMPEILLTRSQWRHEDGDYSAALDDLTELAALYPDDPAILIARATEYQHLGRHDEAIADWKSLDRLSQTGGIPSRSEALNGLAYARAVGKRELDEALAGVEEALKFAPRDPMILDTRGFILFHQGKHDAALTDMNDAVRGVEDLFKHPPGNRRVDEQGVAVVRYHRALVLEKLGRFAEAKADRARAKLLVGREPDETLF